MCSAEKITGAKLLYQYLSDCVFVSGQATTNQYNSVSTVQTTLQLKLGRYLGTEEIEVSTVSAQVDEGVVCAKQTQHISIATG